MKNSSVSRVSVPVKSILFTFVVFCLVAPCGLAQELPGDSTPLNGGLPRNKIVGTIRVGSQPSYEVVSPNSATLYVSNWGSGTVSVIDTASRKVTFTISVGPLPSGLAITPDGKFLYLANLQNGTVSVINTSTNTVATTVAVGDQPVEIALSPDGKSLYVPFNLPSDPYHSGIAIIDTATNQIAQTILTGTTRAEQFVFSPDGAYAYALADLNIGQGYRFGLLRIATQSKQLTQLVWGQLIEPDGIAITPDNSKLYFGIRRHQVLGSVAVFNIAQGLIEKKIALPSSVYGGSAITPDGKYLYFPSQGNVLMVSTATDKIVGSPISVALNVPYVVVAPDGNYAYALDTGKGASVTVIDIRPK